MKTCDFLNQFGAGRTRSVARDIIAQHSVTRRRGPAGRLLERLEMRCLLSTLPTGYVDVLDRNSISGWAYDPDTGASPIQVEIDVDSTPTKITASANRADLTPVIGSPNHGFSMATPTLSPGDHNIKVSVIDPSTGNLVVLRQATLTNPSPSGSIDVLNNGTIAGWAFDPDAGANPINVRVDVNGSTVLNQAASGNRPDLTPVVGSPNHGFNFTGNFNGVVEIFAIDNPTGQAVLLKSTNIRPVGYVDASTLTSVSGWAYDPNHSTGTVQIRVDVDGTTLVTGTADGNRADLTPVIGSPNHGYNITFAALGPGSHKIDVFAIDPDTQVNPAQLIGEMTVNNPPPSGFLDAASRTNVMGWVYDPDSPTTSLNVEVHVDGSTVATGMANMNRADLTPVIGSPNHGYSINLSNLAAGPHKIEMFAQDSPSGQMSKFATQVIDNHLPSGSLDMVTQQFIMGWAFDPDPNGPAKVRLVVDGATYGIYTADKARSDLTAVLGDPNHAFSVTTPLVGFGNHTVQIYAQDTFTGQEVLIGTNTLVNNAPVGSFDNATATEVFGWAYDPDQATASINVLLQIDGQIVAQGPANMNRADLTPVIGSPNHGFRITFAGLPTGTHTMKVYAVDPVFGVSVLLGTRVVTVA